MGFISSTPFFRFDAGGSTFMHFGFGWQRKYAGVLYTVPRIPNIVLCADCPDCLDDTIKFIALGPHDKAYWG
jgi:hypothetical protein